MQPGPITGDLLDIVVDRIDQRADVAERSLSNEIAAKPIESSASTALARDSSSRWRCHSSCQAFAAARFSAFVMALSKRGAGESQIVNW